MKSNQNTESNGLPTNALGQENNSNSSKIKEITAVDNTPFAIVTANDTETAEHCIVCGNVRVSGFFETKEEAINYINERPWNLICAAISVISERAAIDAITNYRIEEASKKAKTVNDKFAVK